jgi:alpha-beta hydrolase superfamily lysophospholipase
VVTEDDYGFISEENPSIALLNDIHRVRKGVKNRYPEPPYFMLGHSMGSYLLRRYLSSQGEGLDGAVIMGTGQEPEAALAAGLALIAAETKKRGARYRSDTVKNLTFGAAYKKFDPTHEDVPNSWLSRDEERVRKYLDDPKCGFVFTLNGYEALLSTVRFDGQTKNVKAIPKDLPIFFVSGEEDPVGNLGKGVKKVYNAFVKAGITDVSCKLYPEDRHEILNELDRDVVMADIADWLDQHLKKPEVPEESEETSENAEEGQEEVAKKTKAAKKETGIFEWFEQHLDRSKDDPEKQELENIEDGMRRKLSPEEFEMETEVLRSDSVIPDVSATEKLVGEPGTEKEAEKTKGKSRRNKKKK